jgi:hypothetical protein
MKTIISSLFLVLILSTFTSCKKNGDVTWWNVDYSIGQITVQMDGATSTITQDVSPSDCNTSGTAQIYDAPGTYNYTAHATTGESWSGTAHITSGGCLKIQLY